MKWLALAVGLGSVWMAWRRLRTRHDQVRDRKDTVSAAWMREQSYDRKGY